MESKNSSSIPPVSVKFNDPQTVNTTNPPDLVDIKITNPLVYIKFWWKKIMANEGIEMKVKARPLTVFGVALIAFSLAFGIGGVVFPKFFPWIKIENNNIPVVSSAPIAEVLKDTALKGTLAKTNTNIPKFYLITTSTEAVTLGIPVGFNLVPFVGKRILAVGSYDSKNKVLEVEDIQDLEVLSTTPVPIPTAVPTVSPSLIPVESPTSTPTQSPVSEE